jgi:hypothetical protein
VIPGNFITEAIRAQYANFATILIQNKFQVANSQIETTNLVNAERTTVWNNTVTHTAVITGSTVGTTSAENLRHFFNAGGKLSFSASRTSGTDRIKNNAWTAFLSSIGTITLNHDTTVSDGSVGAGSNIGFFDITTTDQRIFTATDPTVFLENSYEIYVKFNEERSSLIFTINFSDIAVEQPIDNSVSGTLTSTVVQHRPFGSNVSVPTLTAIHSGLDTTGQVTLEYYITTTATEVNEDESAVNFNVLSNVDNGVQLFWTTIGSVSPEDFTDSVSSGAIIIDNNIATITRRVKADKILEGTEPFAIQLRTNSITGPVVATSTYITVQDTSMYDFSVDKTVIAEPFISDDPGLKTLNYSISSSAAANNRTLYITFAGTILNSDIEGGIGTRTVTLVNSAATGTVSVAADSIFDPDKYFVLELRNFSASGPIVAITPVITVSDRTATYQLGTLVPQTATGTQTFSTAGSSTFIVPAYVTSLNVTTYGGGGGGGGPKWVGGKNDWYGGFVGVGGAGGNGQIASKTIAVSASEPLALTVGHGGGIGNGWSGSGSVYGSPGGSTVLSKSGVAQLTSTGGHGGNWGTGGVPPAQIYGRGGWGYGSNYGQSYPGSPGAIVISWSQNYNIINETLGMNLAEGSTLTFHIMTNLIPNNTVLYYNPVGTNITDSDFVGGIFGRSLTVVNGLASGSITIAVDNLTETLESFAIQLRTSSPQGSVVKTSNLVNIVS